MASCQFPYLVKNPSILAGSSFTGESHIPVPCGKCYDCRMRTISQWAFRIQQEEKVSYSSAFVTLTYDDNCPRSPNGFLTLVKKEFQDFMKRLRYFHDKKYRSKIKYFAVGEYGSKRGRPHFHAIILNADSELITKAWPFGFVHIAEVTGASIAYTLKYMQKESKIPLHSRDDRLKEFRLMSKKLGLSFLSESVMDHLKISGKYYVTMDDKYKIPLSRYFKEKIFNEVERKKINLELKRKAENLESVKETAFKKVKTNHKTLKDYERAKSEYKRVRAEARTNREVD